MKYQWQKIGNGSIDNLGFQLAKIIRNSNANRFETRRRYLKAQKRFIIHVGKKFRLQNLRNIKDLHLESYAKSLKEKECTNQYIKTELSAIRFLHNQVENTQYILEDSRVFNKKLEVSKADSDATTIYRAWSKTEIKRMKEIAKKLNRESIVKVIDVQSELGLRLDETVTLKSYQVRIALKRGKIDLTNTKGGVPRVVELSTEARKILESLDLSKRYCITPEEYANKNTIHKFKKSVQNFIYNHREKIQDDYREKSAHNLNDDEAGPLTSHGLRHAFARREYQKFRKQGYSKFKSRENVSELLGHHRDNITKVYISNL